MKLVTALIAAIALAIPPQCIASSTTEIMFFQSSPAASLAGTWKLVAGDASATQVVTLELRGDGTYTKTLDANVGCSHYGGTHDGTWTAEGMVVHLSGSSDSRWPPYTHDLTKFRRVK